MYDYKYLLASFRCKVEEVCTAAVTLCTSGAVLTRTNPILVTLKICRTTGITFTLNTSLSSMKAIVTCITPAAGSCHNSRSTWALAGHWITNLIWRSQDTAITSWKIVIVQRTLVGKPERDIPDACYGKSSVSSRWKCWIKMSDETQKLQMKVENVRYNKKCKM